jgi:glutamate/tyrosine decarboxylase-like PLP-dependent enzyme
MSRPRPPEPTCDLNWDPDRAREFGTDVLELWEEFLRRLPELSVSRVWTTDEVRDAVVIPVPDDPMPQEDLRRYLHDLVFEYAMYPGHSGFMAYIMGPSTVPGAAVDLLAAGINQNLGGWRLGPGAMEIELHLMQWFAQRLGLPEGSGGIFTSGGAMAAYVALKVARDAMAGWDVRTDGVSAGPQLTIYASSEAHGVNDRAADMLGLGRAAVRVIPVDDDLRMRLDALRAAIAADIQKDHRPVAVVASAGTVGTGTVDPLDAIADVCEEYGIWYHIDGAYGGVAAMVDKLRPKFRGIERADSIAVDPHKWLYTPQSGGGVILRDFEGLSHSFSVDASYVHEDKELTGRGIDLFPRGPQWSRSFQGLKLWVSLLAHGWDAYQRRIAHDCALARYLYDMATERPDFETLPDPPELSITCVRYVPPDLAAGAAAGARGEFEEYVDRLNERLMAEIQMHGRVFPSNTVIDGRFWLRACIVNFRTEAEDMDALLDVAADLGAELDGEMRPELG